jgi:signal transduction histidine kinase
MQAMANDDGRCNRAEGLDEFIDGAPCGLLTVAADGSILMVNAVFAAWTGYRREELVGLRRFDELLTVAGRMYYETHLSPLLRLQGFVHEIALDIVCQDDHLLPIFVNAVEKPAANGTVELVRVAVFAAVERRAYERELLLARRNSEQAAKAKADFLAMFAHEIRNPLAAVLMEIELLLRHATASTDEEAIARMRTSIARVLGLLSNMLDISKLEAGRLGLDETEFELANVVQAVVHTLRPLAQLKHLPMQVGVDPALPKRVCGDPVKLGQALINLVGNAIKFTDSGLITIGAERVSQSSDLVNVRFWVQDTGIGIASDRQSLIFDEYTQADPSIARRYGGTGLGLAITTKLVELQRGHLSVHSEPGRGSVFSFEIPLRKAS